MKDHIESSRLVFSDRDGNGIVNQDEIIQQYHSCPYGAPLTGEWNNTLKKDYNYKRVGAERHLDFDLDWDFHPFRTYDPWVPGWGQPDPLLSNCVRRGI